MGIETQIQLFDNAKIRVAWDDEKEKYFFSVVDVIGVLTESTDGRTYWKVLKNRLLKEGNETVTNCNQLKLPASDGKMRLTDVADLEGILRIVQSVPSKKAEPIKERKLIGHRQLECMSPSQEIFPKMSLVLVEHKATLRKYVKDLN